MEACVVPADFYDFPLKDIISIVVTLAVFIIGYILEGKARKIQTALTWKEFRDPIINLSNEVIFVLSTAATLCDADQSKIGKDEYWNRYSDNLTKLTSYVDQGRIVIPNLFLPDNSAYGGRRDKVLDCILAGYEISKSINYTGHAFNKIPTNNIDDTQYKKIKSALAKLPNQERVKELEAKFKGWSCKSALIEVKRQFVEEVSGIVQARQWVKDIKELAGRQNVYTRPMV